MSAMVGVVVLYSKLYGKRSVWRSDIEEGKIIDKKKEKKEEVERVRFLFANSLDLIVWMWRVGWLVSFPAQLGRSV